MKFIDANCMIGPWRYREFRINSVKDLLNEMDRLGIEKALVYHSASWFWDPAEGNRILIKQSSEIERLIPVMAGSPLIEQELGGRKGMLEFICKNRIGGIRLFPNDHNYTLSKWNMISLFEITNQLKIPVMIEGKPNEGSIDKYFDSIVDLACSYKNTPVIISDLKLQYLRVLYPMMDKCSNIYVDTSTLYPFRGIEETVKYFGAHRILFGSRTPFIDTGVAVGRIVYSGLDKADRQKVAYGNIEKLVENINYTELG
jgi:hypothetical protein